VESGGRESRPHDERSDRGEGLSGSALPLPRRVDADARDRELAAIVANVPGAVYRCALDRNWTME